MHDKAIQSTCAILPISFIEAENVSDEFEALQDGIAEGEDASEEVAIEMYKEAQQTAREVERFSKEVGE